jgi:hypothetical protein
MRGFETARTTGRPGTTQPAAPTRLAAHDGHERIGKVGLAWLAKTRPPCQVKEVVGLVLDSREEHGAIFGREGKAPLERAVGIEPSP